MSSREGTYIWPLWYTLSRDEDTIVHLSMRNTSGQNVHTFLVTDIPPGPKEGGYVTCNDEKVMLFSWVDLWMRMPAQALLAAFGLKNTLAPLIVNKCLRYRIKPPTWMCMSLVDRFNSNRCLVELSNIYTQGNSYRRRGELLPDEMLAWWNYDVKPLDMSTIFDDIHNNKVPDLKPIALRLEACEQLYLNYDWA